MNHEQWIKEVSNKQCRKITQHYLDIIKPRYARNQYPIPKWIIFTEQLLQWNWQIFLYRAKSTYSKYLYISKGKQTIKVRFSNHKPNKFNQVNNDSDYYVGISHSESLTTEALLEKLSLY